MTIHHGADTVQDRPDFITVAEAARQLGISPTTVKRRIAHGTLEAEQLARPQGFEYRVRLTRTVQAPVTAPSTAPSDSEEPAPPSGTTQDVAAAITAATAPLLVMLERQAEQLIAQASTIGCLEAELRAARAVYSPGALNLTPISPESTWWPSLSSARSWAVYGGLVLVIVAGLALVLMLAPGMWR